MVAVGVVPARGARWWSLVADSVVEGALDFYGAMLAESYGLDRRAERPVLWLRRAAAAVAWCLAVGPGAMLTEP